MQSPPAAHCGQSLLTSEQSEEQMPHETLRRKQAGSAFGQLGGGRLLSAPEHAPGCPKLRPASADPPLGSRWPADTGHAFDIATCGHVVAMLGFFLHSPLRAQPPQASSLS